jgi:hypothetical protein
VSAFVTPSPRVRNLGTAGELEAGAVSQEEFRFRGLCLRRANNQTGRHRDLTNRAGGHGGFERRGVALQIQVLYLEVGLVHTYGSNVIIYAQCGELGEAVFKQRIKISKLERQGLNDPYLYPQPTGIAG